MMHVRAPCVRFSTAKRGLTEGVGGHMGYGHCLSTLEIFQSALSGPDGLLAGKALKTLVNTCTVNPQQRNPP
jgi:hypothetical protein